MPTLGMYAVPPTSLFCQKMAAPLDVTTAVKPAEMVFKNQEESKMKQKHHVFEGERLGAFSDAVFAIVATIMVSHKLCTSSIRLHCILTLKIIQ